MKEEIYIFDIDDCIMPAIISNSEDNNHSREQTVKESISNGHKIKLYPDFINYYKQHCERAKLVFFITGRKKSEFGSLTEFQLKPLDRIKRYQIIYYPEGKGHQTDEYFEWKIKKIEEILENNAKYQLNKSNNDKNDLSVKIFDDMNDYFSKVEDLAKKFEIKIKFHLIKGEKSWIKLNN